MASSVAQRFAPALAPAVDRCAELVQAELSQPGLPGSAGLDVSLPALTLEHDLEPMVWLRAPELSQGGPVVRAYRRRLLESDYPGDLAERMVSSLTSSRVRARAAYLREGMLYAEIPAVARVLVRRVRLRHLFADPVVEVTRRGQRSSAERGGDGLYRWAAGPLAGRRVRLELMDRLGVPGAPAVEAAFRSLRALSLRLGFDALRVQHRGQQRLVLELSYGRGRSQALVLVGRELELVCEAPVGDAALLLAERDKLRRSRRVMSQLERAMDNQIRLELPFDEPKTEEGQQDGALRNAWIKAYERGRRSYTFNGDRYRIYSRSGEPRAPQVCVDFITETWELASGTHFRERGASGGPGRVVGGIEFDQLLGAARRQVAALIELSHRDRERFDVLDIRPGRWVPYEKLDRFHANLAELSPQIRRGDVLIIRGTVPWDRKRRDHYHSFFVREVCPITGVPTRLTGNALRPRTVSWRAEMSRAPKRSIRHRIRPRLEWLEAALGDSKGLGADSAR